MVFSGRPLLIDEIIQVVQARIFASGRLWLPAPAHPEFTSSMHLIDTGKVYGQFPAGGPAMLALGTLVRAEWLVGPVAGVVSAWAFARLLRLIEPRRFVRRLALALFALAPFVVFMSGSHMNHVTSLMWLLLATTALFSAVQGRRRPHPWPALGAASRWAWRRRSARSTPWPSRCRPASGCSGARAGSQRAGASSSRRGSASRCRWPRSAPSTGPPPGRRSASATPSCGAARTTSAFTPRHGATCTRRRAGSSCSTSTSCGCRATSSRPRSPRSCPAIAWLGLGREHDRADRFFLVSGALLCLLYAAYWHDGFYLGPRFLFALAPGARPLVRARRRRFPVGNPLVRRALGVALVTGVLIGLVVLVPTGCEQYQQGMTSLRWDPDAELARAGVKDALVLVRESWGSELLVRLWALGVSRPAAEHYYRAIDPCVLEQTIGGLERDRRRLRPRAGGAGAAGGDSVRLVRSDRVQSIRRCGACRGSSTRRCASERLAEDAAGFTLFPPQPAVATHGRALRARPARRATACCSRGYEGPIYLLKPSSPAVGAVPQFYPVSVDSLWATWRAAQ